MGVSGEEFCGINKAWARVLAMSKIKHEARGQDANKARGEVECFILRIARARHALTVLKNLATLRLVLHWHLGRVARAFFTYS